MIDKKVDHLEELKKEYRGKEGNEKYIEIVEDQIKAINMEILRQKKAYEEERERFHKVIIEYRDFSFKCGIISHLIGGSICSYKWIRKKGNQTKDDECRFDHPVDHHK